jgi:hypothetical protein
MATDETSPPVDDKSFPKQAEGIIEAVDLDQAHGSDSLRGSATVADQDFLDEDLEVSCAAMYCSKLYKLQVCRWIGLGRDGCEGENTDDDWRDLRENEIVSCNDKYGTKWLRNDLYGEVLPFVTCKTSWGSAPNGGRDINWCWDEDVDSYIIKYRYVEISGSLKNKKENKCENRCDYEGPKMNSLSLWGCCDNNVDEDLGCF